jgi:hypothetical protein
MKKWIGLFLALLVMLVSCSKDKYSPTIRFPYLWLDEPGYGGNIDKQNFPEPSGICFHPLRKTLFVVSDEGEVTEIETDGTPVFRMAIPGDLDWSSTRIKGKSSGHSLSIGRIREILIISRSAQRGSIMESNPSRS